MVPYFFLHPILFRRYDWSVLSLVYPKRPSKQHAKPNTKIEPQQFIKSIRMEWMISKCARMPTFCRYSVRRNKKNVVMKSINKLKLTQASTEMLRLENQKQTFMEWLFRLICHIYGGHDCFLSPWQKKRLLKWYYFIGISGALAIA